MSRLGDNLHLIQMEPNQRRYAEENLDPMRFLKIEKHITAMVPPRMETRYVLTSTAYAELWLSPLREREQQEFTKQARDCILAEVFGEFRMPLMKARHHINNGERAQASAILADILESMFK